MPDAYRHQGSTFLSDNATVKALEGIYKKIEQLCSDGRGKSLI